MSKVAFIVRRHMPEPEPSCTHAWPCPWRTAYGTCAQRDGCRQERFAGWGTWIRIDGEWQLVRAESWKEEPEG